MKPLTTKQPPAAPTRKLPDFIIDLLLPQCPGCAIQGHHPRLISNGLRRPPDGPTRYYRCTRCNSLIKAHILNPRDDSEES